jgi:uncharacterized Zn-finger protein
MLVRIIIGKNALKSVYKHLASKTQYAHPRVYVRMAC